MARLHQLLPRLFVSLILAATIACTGAEGPAGPSGGGTLTRAIGTGSLILDDDVLGFTPIPGLSVTVTATAGQTNDVLIETDGGIQVNSDVTSAVCFTDIAIFVDGAQVGPGRRVGVANTPEVVFNVGAYGFSVVSELAPGTHTITVQAKAYSPRAAVQCYVSSGANGSDLPGRPKLQAVLNVVLSS